MLVTVLSPCKRYRYQLGRDMCQREGTLLFIMLNPSTADADHDDATIRKLRGFTERLGYRYISVVNLFAFRATDPKELKTVSDAIGEDNSFYIKLNAERADKIICGWGTHGVYGRQNEKVMDYLSAYDLYALELTKDGHPKHPLYISYDKQPILFRARKNTPKDIARAEQKAGE